MMEPSIEFVPVEVKEEQIDNQVSSSHLPSSLGVDKVTDADRNSRLMMNPSEDPLKVEVKEELCDDLTYATLPIASSQQSSGMGRLRNYSEDTLSQCGRTDIKEEDIWIKDEPVEDLDLIAGSTTTFTPKPRSTGNKDCHQYKTRSQTAGGSTAPPSTQPVTTTLLPLEPFTNNKNSSAHTEEAAKCGAIACSNPAEDTDSGPSPPVRHVTTSSGDLVPISQCQTDDSTGPVMQPPGKKQKIAANEKLKASKLAKERTAVLRDMNRELYEKQLEVLKAEQEILEIQLANAKRQHELEKTHAEARRQLQQVHSEELRQLKGKFMEEQH